MRNQAVLFADVCDSARLYGRLGDAAAQGVINGCLSLIGEIVARHGGRVVKTIGDEAMCVFDSADAAISAAIEVQNSVSARRWNGQAVQLHMGLHYGPVLAENGDVFGDTVNAAAYLTAVAAEEQILTTEAVEKHLSPALASAVRPVFRSVLKGSTEESAVYQVLWYRDTVELTDVNLHLHRIIPGDEGSLLVSHRGLTLRLDQKQPNITIGRGEDCDLIVQEKFASRRHVSIRLLRTHFYLVDHSINGTFVVLESGEQVHVLRGELLLDTSGRISLGRAIDAGASETITFTRDRRSMYRVE